MRIYLATDHRGAEIKEDLIINLHNLGYDNIFLPTIDNKDGDDYVDYALNVLNKMDKNNDIAVLICGNGIGMSIIANKVKKVHCARVVNENEAIAARTHNGANALALGADLGVQALVDIIDTFIKTELPNEERHQRRVNKIIQYEEGTYNEL